MRDDVTAETALAALATTLERYGLPATLTLDRDPRFVGSAGPRDVPSPLRRFLLCLGVQVCVCPPRRPDLNGCVERDTRTDDAECLRRDAPADLESAHVATAAFQEHSNRERPHQARPCGNRPPRVAWPEFPPRPSLPSVVDPDRWLQTLDGRRYARQVRGNGTVSVDEVSSDIAYHRGGQSVTLPVDAAARTFMVAAGDRVLACLPINGTGQPPLPDADYLLQMRAQARTGGGPAHGAPLQLRLPL